MSNSKRISKNHNSKQKHLIGTLGEKSLHSALKKWYARPKDRIEVEVEGYHIDIKRRNLLIEIQTTNFHSLRRKLATLMEKHPVRLVFPIAQEKWIVRMAKDMKTRIGRRKSPKKGNVFHLFDELVYIPGLITHPNFSLETLLIQEEEVRCDDGTGSWRRNGLRIADHRLIDVLSQHTFRDTSDFLALIPADLPEPFSTKDLAESIEQPRRIAQQVAYCLRHMGAIALVGKNRNALLYSVTNTP
jgi:hypothetical protein